jgi:hypothetical protein
MPIGYAPQNYGVRKPRFSERVRIRVPTSLKMGLWILVGSIVAVLVVFYMMLGDLKFFANHIFGLGFVSKHYLVLLQNNYELRPTGGFVTGYGTVDTFMGMPTKIEFRNSYDIDTETYVAPPKPQGELLKPETYKGYTFRDANWEPDLRKTVPDILRFYNDKYKGQTVDGVITVNFSLIEKWVERLGGIELGGKKLDGKNLFSALEFEVNNVDRHNVEALTNRKNILGDLAVTLMAKAKRHPLLSRDVLVQGLREKDLAIWLKNENLEKDLIEKGWANAMIPAEKSDFLAVNLANYGAKKADRYLQTDVRYYANLSGGIPEITTEITIRFPGRLNSFSDNYKGYLRVYLPKESDVTNSPVDSEIVVEDPFRVVGSKIILPAGNKITLTYIYTLPRTALPNDQFKLRLIKQPGTYASYNVTAEASEGKLAEGRLFRSLENRAVFEGRLENDLDLSVKWAAEKSPPYPIEQEFTDLSRIQITWNKPIAPTEASESSNYQIMDLDKGNPKTDTVKVVKAELTEPNILVLELEGVTDQNQEHYSIEMKGIRDLAGDEILPNPKTVTAVQRIKPKPAANLNFHLGVVPAPATNPVKP